MAFVTRLKNRINREKKVPYLRKKTIWAIFHAGFMVLLTFALQYSSFIRHDEAIFLKWAAVFRHNILHLDRKPEKDNVVFIDISKDLALADDPTYDSISPNLAGAKKLITDRYKLARFFHILNAHSGQYKFILCDILFDQKGPGDDVLRPEIAKLKNSVCSAAWADENLYKPIFSVPYGAVNYTAIDEVIFTKLPFYYQNNLPSLPMVMFEKTDSARFKKSEGLVWYNDRFSFNYLIPEFYYRAVDLQRSNTSGHFNTYYLGELLWDTKKFENSIANKFIVIGDFSNEMHSTYLENMPGALILWNSFLTIRQHPPGVSIAWVLLIFLFYFIISYWIFVHPEKSFEDFHKQIKIPLVKEFVIRCISFIGIMILINIISFIFFGTYISLFYLASYLTILQISINKLPYLNIKSLSFLIPPKK